MREVEQEQEQEHEEESEDSVDDVDHEVIDLTATDVALSQQQQEEATASLFYDDVGD